MLTMGPAGASFHHEGLGNVLFNQGLGLSGYSRKTYFIISIFLVSRVLPAASR
jgi:hypothetical protein